MNIHNVSFMTSVYSKEKLVSYPQPQIVMSGRSNVGKSSLINALLGRKDFARTSAVPGKTACVNFYNIDNAVILTDLPGYGYAKRSKSETAKWGELIEGYFDFTDGIAIVFLLFDIRHAPTKDDITMLNFVRGMGFDYKIILTKSDKLSKGAANAAKTAVCENCAIADTDVFIFSAKTKQNRGELLAEIENIIKKEI